MKNELPPIAKHAARIFVAVDDAMTTPIDTSAAAVSDAKRIADASRTTEWIDRLVAAGRILERYEDPRLRPLSKENFRFYDAARREISSIRERFAPEQKEPTP